MSSSLRARRMARNHRRLAQQNKLNLVALMDIFTILVLFLMVNNGDVEVLQPDKDVSLPDSISEQRPELSLLIKISQNDIYLQGQWLDSIDNVLAVPGQSFEALSAALKEQAALLPALTEDQQQLGRPVIITGHRDMPYQLLKRIMAGCAETEYRNISLAVNSKPVEVAEQLLATLGEGGL